MSGNFRVSVWDPALVISQIIAVVGFFYFSLGFLVIIGSVCMGNDLALSNLFGYKALSFNDRQGFLAVACYIVNALLGSLALYTIVKRTKQCLDFTATTYLLHLLCCWIYNGAVPVSATWWLVNFAAIAVMCVCGEFLCLKSEMQDIPLLGARVDL